MGGLAGAFFEPLALSFLLAMLASMVVAMTVTPALCFIMLGHSDTYHRESPLVPWLKRKYHGMLSRIVHAPRATFASALIVVFAGLGERNKAISLAEKVRVQLREKPDHCLGPYAMEDVAFIYTKTGMYSEAFNIIRQLLSKPGPHTISLLEIDPRWAPLRKMTEYRKLKTELL